MKHPSLVASANFQIQPPLVRGKWFDIKLMPDLATGELWNVGVCVLDKKGKFYPRVLEDTNVLTSIYGEQMLEMIGFLLEVLKESLSAGCPVSPSPHLVFGQPKFAAGDSIEAILEEAFITNVRLAYKKAGRRRTRAMDNEKARQQVFNAMQRLAGPQAEQIIAGTDKFIVPEKGQAHVLDIPLYGSDYFGSIVSACYTTTERSEINILRAVMDLKTAWRLFPNHQPGLFILKPEANSPILTMRQHEVIDERIERIDWQFKKMGMHLGIGQEPGLLAEKILGWAQAR